MFPHPYKWCFVLISNQCGTSQSTPFVHSPIDAEPPPNPPPFGPSVLTGTPSRVYPLRGIARRLANRLVSGSDTICNRQDPQVDIVLLGFPSRV